MTVFDLQVALAAASSVAVATLHNKSESAVLHGENDLKVDAEEEEVQQVTPPSPPVPHGRYTNVAL